MQDQNSARQLSNIPDKENYEDIDEEELSEKEVAILFLIAAIFVTVIIVLPIVLSMSPTYK